MSPCLLHTNKSPPSSGAHQAEEAHMDLKAQATGQISIDKIIVIIIITIIIFIIIL